MQASGLQIGLDKVELGRARVNVVERKGPSPVKRSFGAGELVRFAWGGSNLFYSIQ
jgi:hypothetical protein